MRGSKSSRGTRMAERRSLRAISRALRIACACVGIALLIALPRAVAFAMQGAAAARGRTPSPRRRVAVGGADARRAAAARAGAAAMAATPADAAAAAAAQGGALAVVLARTAGPRRQRLARFAAMTPHSAPGARTLPRIPAVAAGGKAAHPRSVSPFSRVAAGGAAPVAREIRERAAGGAAVEWAAALGCRQ